jgi:Holliday junction resolvase-like predicted endonuclease
VRNTSRVGNSAEVFVAKWLEERGWVVGSRRHIGGAGDLLAVLPSSGMTWLIEVKCCKNVWQQFRRSDRDDMRATELPEGAERYVCNVLSVKKEELVFLGERSWP